MPYEDDVAQVYDLYNLPDRSPEADLWARLAGPSAKHLLEPMVGTAEVALLLAARGFFVTGVDLSAPMLHVAEQRRRAAGNGTGDRLTLIEADISRVVLPLDRYDLAYVGNGSWHLLTEERTRREALRIICRSLRAGGKLALQLFPPLTASGRSEPRTFKPFRPAPAWLNVVKTSTLERDADTQLMRIHEVLTVNGRVTEHDLMLRLLTPEQLTAELRAAGFQDVALYGSSDLATPWAPGAPDLIAVAHR